MAARPFSIVQLPDRPGFELADLSGKNLAIAQLRRPDRPDQPTGNLARPSS
jgi:hypothetical protein